MWPEFSARVASFRRSMGVTQARGASAMDEPGDETPRLDQFSAESFWLSEQFLGPLRKELTAKPRLIVAATGIVSNIPLSALLMSEPSPGDDYAKMDWLVRHHSVQVVPAVELLAGDPEQPVRGEASYLGFADPDYRGVTGDIAPRQSRMLALLRALPETGDEVRAIAAAFDPGRAKLFMGLEANEHNLQVLSDSGDLSRYAVVHFATHGLLPGEAELSADQALALSPRLEGQESLSDWIEAMTPAGSYKSFPDGLLTDREILGLKMNADLVLLSACNTGIASSMNLDDGFSGISAAFLAAGSRSVMASYWPIDTNAAVELMKLAVPAILRGEPPAAALQNAMLTLIEKGGNSADPRYWAPLAVYGQP